MKFAIEHDEKTFCVAWLPDGKSFVIRNPDEFTRQVLPKYFKATKFSSFTRKLYRWGFRQVNRGIGPDDPIIFGNEFFQRDDMELMKKMRSITAASARKSQEQQEQYPQQIDNMIRGGLLLQGSGHPHHPQNNKRTIDDVIMGSEQQHQLMESNNKRVQLLDQILQQNLLNSLTQQQQQNQGTNNAFVGVGGQQYQPSNALNNSGSIGNGGGFDTFESLFSSSPNVITGGTGTVGGGSYNNGGGLKPFENLFSSHNFQPQSSSSHRTNPLLSMAFPRSHHQQQQLPTLSSRNNASSSFGNNSNGNSNTLDIVNAAINALRYSS